MTGVAGKVKAMVASQADKHATNAKEKVGAAATPDNGGNDTDVQSQIDAVLTANPPSWLFLCGALCILVAGGGLGYLVWRAARPSDFMPSTNYAVYAGLFIMALAIERVLEPFAGYIVPSTTMKKARVSATAANVTRVKANSQPQPTSALAAAQSQTAVASKEHHRSQANRAVLMWAMASALAMVICASVGIFLLRSVEAPSAQGASASGSPDSTLPKESPTSPPNRWVDLVVTGLVVGAGTKPLHDLISNIQTSSSNSQSKSTAS